MDPIKEEMSEQLITIFDGSSPTKHLNTVYECLETVREHDIDVIVGVGGGSTLDIARAVRLFNAIDDSVEEIKKR